MNNASATLRIRVPALVREPRGAIIAAALMVRLWSGIAVAAGAVLALASGRSLPAPASLLRD